MKDTNLRADAEKAVAQLVENKHDLEECWDMLRNKYPNIFVHIDELREQTASLTSTAKDAVRALGPGNHEFKGKFILVKRPPMKKTLDREGLIDRAEERGEVQDLLDAEVLTYSVQGHMIPRLTDGKMKAIYAGYLSESPGTSSVVLPADLK